MIRALIALSAAACAAAALAPASASAGSSAPCRTSAVVPLDVGAAARIPEASGDTTAPVGATRAATIANTLRTGAGNICTLPPTPQVAAQLQTISRLYASGQRATAHGRLIALLAQIKRRPIHPRPVARTLAGAPCRATRVDVKLKGATKAADALKAAAAAQQAHDQAAADQATAQAKVAYDQWADNGSGATSAGDYVALAAGAEKLGADETAGRVDQAAAGDIAQSLADRLNHKIPAGCEEWSFTMKYADSTTGWGITWGAGRFRVNRKTGVIDGSQAAGFGQGWGGIIGSWNGECIETTPDGTTDLGPAAIVGGPFHYTIDGTVDDEGFHLQIASPDGHADVQQPADPMCQWLGTLAQQFVDLLVSGPNPVDVPVGPNDPSFTVDESQGDYTLTLTVTRVQ